MRVRVKQVLAGAMFMGTMTLVSALAAGAAAGQTGPAPGDDPRVGLRAGLHDAGTAAHGLELVTNVPLPDAFAAARTGMLSNANSDLAFQGDHVFVGNFHGFNVYDISDPAAPRLRTSFECPGGQGDVSVHGNLLFMSVEETRGRVDCGLGGTSGPVDPERFRGVRIFDISDLDAPRQIAAVQTCRGSHTHTLVRSPNDAANLYVYVSGTSVARPGDELAGCSPVQSPEDTTTSYWSIAVIRVPLANPQEARVVGEPRVFADESTGEIAGLWRGGTHGEGTQTTAQTNQCHDITAFPAIGLAAGACAGNGILFDISDPANPVRIDAVTDPNFAYWHSATFNHDGSKVIFTDEWGGGTAPRCQASDSPEWGANAIFEVVDRRLRFAGYYKLPAPQTATENCVAHNGSIIPVPGRDIMAQAWYQGGISVFDFTDPENPVEIAYFDRGPLDESRLEIGGHWSAYWYNGHLYASEMARGLDVLRVLPGDQISGNELRAASEIRFDELNVQEQPALDFAASFTAARARLDQVARAGALPQDRVARVAAELDRAEATTDRAARRAALQALAGQLDTELPRVEPSRQPPLRGLARALRQLGGTGTR